MPLQIPPLSLHSWRPSTSPSKCGSHHFFLFLSFPFPHLLLSLSATDRRRRSPRRLQQTDTSFTAFSFSYTREADSSTRAAVHGGQACPEAPRGSE
jgi:hypothetical protein